MAAPTTRVLAVLELLQAHGRMSGPALAARLGVDGRTLRRYMRTLEDLGIPITTERGRHGAYMLVAGFKLPPMMFTNEEAVALSVGMVAARGLGLAEGAPAVESAHAKLTRVMPEGLKGQVGAIADTIKLEQLPTLSTPASNAMLMSLIAAAQSRSRVHMGYLAPGGGRTERDFDPYGMAWRAGAWYTVGMCHLRRDVRSFRVDRVTGLQVLPVAFERPAGFDPLAQLMRGIATLPHGRTIEVLLHADLDTATRAFSPAIGLFEPVADGVLLRSSASDGDMGWFARQLAALGFDFEILAPDILRKELATLATRLHAVAVDALV
ncbi:helix-turn-helix transcriptional regulator [Luteibacter yeojuensis]|uniref:YafY family transcriptional regulator n=1 Tax=Luteibacter yeojuensis TaxID=345309 RepID=A0A7X5TRM5_9GAMM|nr:YafY family protein [Luteibacter yeojuensis]NID16983.1 YafY family transcriptional regulator [Luteibacter yeojuensis]